jgi:signal transduction histidine kinase
MASRRIRGSIITKLIGLAALPIAAIIGFLVYYFPAQQIAQLTADQERRAQTYADLLADELRSAVAFSDRETAREVLTSLRADPQAVSTSLFAADGKILYQHGAPSAWVQRASAGVAQKRMFSGGDRVATVVPVVSLEGPRGTLVIELSTRELRARERTVIRTAVLLGAAALVFGVLASWWIARSLVRRLRAINDVARTVAAGGDGRVEIHTRDELGELATSFNNMVRRLRRTQAKLEFNVEVLKLAEVELTDKTNRQSLDLAAAAAESRRESERRAKMEIELRQAQKLESVGRLASGIAHEINTPLQFANDSCSFLDNATTDLLGLIAARRDAFAAGGTLDEIQTKIADAEEAADVDYLLDQVPQAVQRALQGMERVSAIVKAMKEFAYADHALPAPADINRAIQSTLTVARNEYKYVADVETDFGDLPHVICHVGELNQVVLNLVVNSAHAIEEVVRGTERRGKIRIRTAIDGGHAVIAIADDGCGIPRAILDKIFDPFFTTKEIGKGSGQGLAIARSVVVDKHGGTLTVDSELGRGSTFTIRIPLQVAKEVALAS